MIKPLAYGAHVGWCNTCGADTFNGPRHRCPKKIGAKTLAVIIAAKLYRDAQIDLRSSSVEAPLSTVHHLNCARHDSEFGACSCGADRAASHHRARCLKAEAEKFDALVSAIAALDADTTIPDVQKGTSP